MEGTEQRVGRRLPTGSHGIPPEVVARNQRERLIAAMAEVCAVRGYAEASVTDIVKHAGVSSVTFYKQFASKQDCMLAAHRQLLGRLLEEVDRAREAADGEEAMARAAIRAALSLFAADSPSARLLTVEILALGSEGAKRHDAMAGAFANRLRPDATPRGDRSPPVADWALAAGAIALIGKLVVAGEAARLPELEDELVALAMLRP